MSKVLEELGIKTGCVPPGGWRYMQPMQTGAVKITAFSAKELLTAALAFRIANHIESAGTAEDIAEWLGKEVEGVKANPGKEPAPRTRTKQPLITDMRDHLLGINGKRPRLVTERVAAERAGACAKCVQNIKWLTACAGCNREVIDMGQNLRRVASAGFDDKLKGCRLHRVLLMAAVFLDTGLPSRHKEAPTECWIPE